jgi:hypothetical protein
MKIIKNPFFMKKILVVFFNLIVLVAFCKEIPKTLKRTIDIDKMATLCAPPNSDGTNVISYLPDHQLKRVLSVRR